MDAAEISKHPVFDGIRALAREIYGEGAMAKERDPIEDALRKADAMESRPGVPDPGRQLLAAIRGMTFDQRKALARLVTDPAWKGE